MWIPQEHQIKIAFTGYQILKENMIVYLATEERTGKTLASLLIAEMCSNVSKVLVVTTKQAIEGWKECLANYRCSKEITVTNYHQVTKLKESFDLVILDEAHNYITSYPKPGKMFKDLKKVTKDKPIIYLSATPHAQSYSQLYHAFGLSSWSPWSRFSTFYRWFDSYGIPETEYIAGRPIIKYNRVQEGKVLADIQKLFISKTRKEIGFKQEPSDKLHYIKLDQVTRAVYNDCQASKVLLLPDDEQLELDSSMKLRSTLHMIEGGVAKRTWLELAKGEPVQKHKFYVMSNKEKIDYILQTWGDTEDICIMYHYRAEFLKLSKYFKKAAILQGTSFAEGVDLHKTKHLIIYSMDFRTSKYSQRRARQANQKRDDPIIVHYLLVAGAISEQVYTTVAVNKINFIDSVYQRNSI